MGIEIIQIERITCDCCKEIVKKTYNGTSHLLNPGRDDDITCSLKVRIFGTRKDSAVCCIPCAIKWLRHEADLLEKEQNNEQNT